MPCAFVHPEYGKTDCQFAVPENELMAFNGQRWCVYHLPMQAKDGTGSPKAGYSWEEVSPFNADIFARIEATVAQTRPKAEEERAAEGNPSEQENEYKEPLDLSGVIFPGPISFSEKTLPDITFSQAQFSSFADFRGAEFSGNAYFTKVQFSGRADAFADFREAQFSGRADFQEAQFSGYAYFTKVQFSGRADFTITPSNPSEEGPQRI